MFWRASVQRFTSGLNEIGSGSMAVDVEIDSVSWSNSFGLDDDSWAVDDRKGVKLWLGLIFLIVDKLDVVPALRLFGVGPTKFFSNTPGFNF